MILFPESLVSKQLHIIRPYDDSNVSVNLKYCFTRSYIGVTEWVEDVKKEMERFV